jgi:hypothetical protein
MIGRAGNSEITVWQRGEWGVFLRALWLFFSILREKPIKRLSVGLVLANCCDLVIIDPPVLTVLFSSQTVWGEKLRKIVRYFGPAQKRKSAAKATACS